MQSITDSDISKIESVRTVHLEPGDLLLFHLKENFADPGVISHIRKTATEAVPDGVRVLIICGDIDITRATLTTKDEDDAEPT